MTPRPRWTLLPLLLLAVLTVAVTLQWPPLLRVDDAVADLVDPPPSPGALEAWTVVTGLGAGPVLSAVGVVAALVLASRRRWAAAAGLLASLVAVFVSWGVLRLVVARPRPGGGLVETATATGFPSGHAANTAAAATLALGVLGPALAYHGRVVLAVLGTSFALTVGISRVVLGVHHLSDVLAGWALGMVVAGTVFGAVHAFLDARSRRPVG